MKCSCATNIWNIGEQRFVNWEQLSHSERRNCYIGVEELDKEKEQIVLASYLFYPVAGNEGCPLCHHRNRPSVINVTPWGTVARNADVFYEYAYNLLAMGQETRQNRFTSLLRRKRRGIS